MDDPFTRLEQQAAALGFRWCGAAPAESLAQELEHLRRWIAEGRHGSMHWLARDPQRRANPLAVLDGCRTVIVLGMNYLAEQPPGEMLPHARPGMGRISKYARTRDYHRVMEKALRKLARWVDNELAPGARTRGYVDYGPVMERPWAARAGLGFAGKHTLLINPAEGSYHFLAVLLTTAHIERPGGEAPPLPGAADGCGDCRRCIDACPTGAITEPWRFDARRCISYLTIEHKGPIAGEFHGQTAGYLFGCDICQDVCPYNRKRAKAQEETPLGPPIVEPEIPLPRLILDSQGFLDSLGEAASPLRRAGAESLTRNAILAVLSAGADEECVAALEAFAADRGRPSWLRELAATILERIGPEGNTPQSQ